MPYTPEHKAKTRQRIVQSARRLFNRKGFAEVSIDDVMAGAGLTRGGFYNHFETKEELYAEAITAILSCNPTEEWGEGRVDFSTDPQNLALTIVRAYLSRQHIEKIDHLCPMIALPSDVARGGDALKRAYQKVLESMVSIFEAHLCTRGNGERSTALTMAALCVGGMVLARAVDDQDLADGIRSAAERQVLELANI